MVVRRNHVCLALVFFSACMVSEGTLQQRFTERRAVLEQLLRMSDVDAKLVRIDPDFTWLADDHNWPRKDPGLTEERWDHYRSLFREFGIERGLMRRKDGVFFFVESIGLGVSGRTRGIAFFPTERPSTEPGFKACGQQKQCFVEIEPGWYLFQED